MKEGGCVNVRYTQQEISPLIRHVADLMRCQLWCSQRLCSGGGSRLSEPTLNCN